MYLSYFSIDLWGFCLKNIEDKRKNCHRKYVLDYQRRRHLLPFLAHQQNAKNLRRFSDALYLISKVFDDMQLFCQKTWQEFRKPCLIIQYQSPVNGKHSGMVPMMHICFYICMDFLRNFSIFTLQPKSVMRSYCSIQFN